MSSEVSRAAAPPRAHLGIAGLDDLPAASSFLSSRWSRDNLLTSHPARLYDGRVLETIDPEALEFFVLEAQRKKGPFELGAARLGVFTWDIACQGAAGPFILELPVALDEPGSWGRAKRALPRLNVENMRLFAERGLGRFLLEPLDLIELEGNVPAAFFAALPEHRPVTFGQGSLQIELSEGKNAWRMLLGPRSTADLLAEMIAVLVYHYEPELDGGVGITDISINDGDFVVKRRQDGSFDLRLTSARRREAGVGQNLFLLYLVQLMAYEDWSVDQVLSALPSLVSNPAVAFAGVVRGLRYRFKDLGRTEEDAVAAARRWIHDFSRSREGRAYRPWAERFLAGKLPLSFGEDVRERWWRLSPFLVRHGLHELRGRLQPASSDAASARNLKALLERLGREIGRLPEEAPDTVRVNDLTREELESLLEELGVRETEAGVLAEFFAHWPYRSLDQLIARVPGLRGIRRLKSRLSFGRTVADTEQATLKSLAPPAKEGSSRPLANPEIFGSVTLPASLHAAAVEAFDSFEAYMDSALHDEAWGYYARSVSIGRAGHFDTHPEAHSPHYGRWIARWAFEAWREMVERGELSEADTYPIVEFGAGNGRLAQDVLDALGSEALAPRAELERWRVFAQRVEYRIYEKSASLREKQRLLLGASAVVSEGDARCPGATLARDFPDGLRGFVVTNEVPDAFGFHKVVLSSEGRALVALVVPRVEVSLREVLGEALYERAVRADASLRGSFAFGEHAGELYLDRATHAEVARTLAGFPQERREALLGALWFEEVYVPLGCFPELAAHFRSNATQYATALAAEDSGVVLYVNVHANRFIRELGASLAAGLIVTIDYGDTTWALVQGARRGDFSFRVYRDEHDYRPRPNDPYAGPGTQDMTADVNFTDLAHAGQEVGLEVVHFGPERDVTGADLPELVARATDKDPLGKLLGNPVFKLLVLGKRASALFSGAWLTPLPLLCREQDVPKARRERIRDLARALVSASE